MKYVCEVCGRLKPMEDYTLKSTGYRFKICKSCYKYRQAGYRAKHKGLLTLTQIRECFRQWCINGGKFKCMHLD